MPQMPPGDNGEYVIDAQALEKLMREAIDSATKKGWRFVEMSPLLSAGRSMDAGWSLTSAIAMTWEWDAEKD